VLSSIIGRSRDLPVRGARPVALTDGLTIDIALACRDYRRCPPG
jgi:hypothetical protein